MVTHKNKSMGILLSLSLLIVLGLVLFVVAGPGVIEYISVNVINTSSTGLSIGSDNGLFTNGTSSGSTNINLSGGLRFNISLIANSSHQNYVNISFAFILTSPEEGLSYSYGNGVTVVNVTVTNRTKVNQSSFSTNNSDILRTDIPDGYYNLSIMVWNNVTNGSSQDLSAQAVINLSRGSNILIDNSAPPINNFVTNLTNVVNNVDAAFQNNSNVTRNGKFAFNVTANDTIYTQSVKVGFRNLFSNGTEFNVTLARGNGTSGISDAYFNRSVFAAEVDLGLMTDGIYTLTVYANDSLKNANNSVSNISFTLDRTGPNVTDLRLGGNFTNYANLSEGVVSLTGGRIFNFTVLVNDSFSNYPVPADRIVFFNITNSTGQINYTRAFVNTSYWQLNLSSNGNATTWGNATIGINFSDERYFPDGLYYINIWANDSLGNNNRTQNLTFRIDRTSPSVSVDCSPSNPTAGQQVTCTCTASDGGSAILSASTGFSGGVMSESTTAGSSGTGTSTTCTAFDYALNKNSASGTWTVTAASSGGGGSGGSGGGSSSGAEGQFEKKTWTSINAGETAKVDVENGVIGVTAVSFAVSDTVYGAWVKVEKEDALPSDAPSFSAKTYRVVEISKGTALTDEKLTKATIDFKVEKKWLEDNGLSKERVAMFRLNQGKWNELPTTLGEDDGTYVHYKAETPGFSFFVIGEKKVAAGPAEEAAPVPSEEAGEAPTEEAQEGTAEEAPETAKKPLGILPIVIVVLVIVAVVVVLVVLKKREE